MNPSNKQADAPSDKKFTGENVFGDLSKILEKVGKGTNCIQIALAAGNCMYAFNPNQQEQWSVIADRLRRFSFGIDKTFSPLITPLFSMLNHVLKNTEQIADKDEKNIQIRAFIEAMKSVATGIPERVVLVDAVRQMCLTLLT